jgi:hypothetical protein
VVLGLSSSLFLLAFSLRPCYTYSVGLVFCLCLSPSPPPFLSPPLWLPPLAWFGAWLLPFLVWGCALCAAPVGRFLVGCVSAPSPRVPWLFPSPRVPRLGSLASGASVSCAVRPAVVGVSPFPASAPVRLLFRFAPGSFASVVSGFVFLVRLRRLPRPSLRCVPPWLGFWLVPARLGFLVPAPRPPRPSLRCVRFFRLCVRVAFVSALVVRRALTGLCVGLSRVPPPCLFSAPRPPGFVVVVGFVVLWLGVLLLAFARSPVVAAACLWWFPLGLVPPGCARPVLFVAVVPAPGVPLLWRPVLAAVSWFGCPLALFRPRGLGSLGLLLVVGGGFACQPPARVSCPCSSCWFWRPVGRFLYGTLWKLG